MQDILDIETDSDSPDAFPQYGMGMEGDSKNPLPKIQVAGVGGAGNNAVYRLMTLGIEGAETIAFNTDNMHLKHTQAHVHHLLGRETTGGFGAGNDPERGELAALESYEDVRDLLDGDLIFVTCGLGGGTGTGAGPVIAQAAKENKGLTVGVVTLPFRMEGSVRMENAHRGLQRICSACDTVVVVPNERLLQISENVENWCSGVTI